METTTLVFEPSSVLLSGKRDTHIEGTATLKNVGEVDFLCKSVSSSCGCTTQQSVKTGTKIKAGESLEISFKVKLSTQGVKHIHVMGNCVTAGLSINTKII